MQYRKRGTATGADADAVTRKNLQILGDRFRVIHIGFDHRITGHQAINLVLADPGIVEHALGRVDAKLGCAELGNFADFGVGCTDDRHLPPQ